MIPVRKERISALLIPIIRFQVLSMWRAPLRGVLEIERERVEIEVVEEIMKVERVESQEIDITGVIEIAIEIDIIIIGIIIDQEEMILKGNNSYSSSTMEKVGRKKEGRNLVLIRAGTQEIAMKGGEIETKINQENEIAIKKKETEIARGAIGNARDLIGREERDGKIQKRRRAPRS